MPLLVWLLVAWPVAGLAVALCVGPLLRRAALRDTVAWDAPLLAQERTDVALTGRRMAVGE